MRFEDATELLALDDDFTTSELARAFRRAALLHHPDRHCGDPHATERFLEIQRAYALLAHHASDAKQPLKPITTPIRVRCVTMGKDLVGSVAIDARRVRRNTWIPLVLWAARTCPWCTGDGEIVVGKSFFGRDVHAPCPHCEGLGVQAVERRIRVRTPSLRSGTALRLRGGGITETPREGEARVGDVVLHLR
ncbi:MAG: DnaJ domain-containing protein [Sandaracinaceae bacterium]|nr:DnaJ domain-containing protein [Sandaracinaceae bacterium]